MTKSRIFFWLLISFILGVAAASFVPLPILLVWAVFILGGPIAAFGLLKAGRGGVVVVSGFVLVAFSFGLFWFARSGQTASAFDRVLDERLILWGVIDDEPVRTAKSQRIVIREKASNLKVLITARQYPEYRYGDLVKISGKIEKPQNFSDDFDYIAYLAKDDIFYAAAFPTIEVVKQNRGNRTFSALVKMKNVFSANINRFIPEPHASFMGGLILGEKRNMPQELDDELKNTGTTHLVALSGYNITIVASAFYSALAMLFIPQSLVFILAVAGIAVFTVVTGAAASVVRAAVMGVLVLVARREGRRYSVRNALALAAAAMLFYNPKILRFDSGFQLSFLATIGLIYASPIVDGYYKKVKLGLIPILRKAGLMREDRSLPRIGANKTSLLAGIFISTLAAQALVLPLLVYRFGRLSLVSPLANLAVLAFIPSTMFFGFLTGALGFVSVLATRAAAWVAWILLDYELKAIGFFSNWPWSSLQISWLTPSAVLLLYVIIGYWLVKAFRKKALDE